MIQAANRGVCFLVLFALLAGASSGAAAAANLVSIGEGPGGKSYLESDSVIRDGDHVLAWVIADSNAPVAIPEKPGKTFLSIRTSVSIDCVGRTVTTTRMAMHAGHLGEGEVLGVHEFQEPPTVDSTGHTGENIAKLIDAACSAVTR
jgi:hypothetical protein